MQAPPAATGVRWSGLAEKIRALIEMPVFCERHRAHQKCFTRRRKLTFPVVMLLLLQKTTRSIQRHLHEVFDRLRAGVPVTGGAWTQARAKFRHTAFIELNQAVVLPSCYATEASAHCRRWRGHRLLGIDGSQLWLPDHPEVIRAFGSVEVANHRGPTGTRYVPGRMSVLYDLLNGLGLDAQLEPLSKSEAAMAAGQLVHLAAGDVVIWDRGFTSFRLMAQVRARAGHFVGRCSSGSFKAAQDLFRLNRGGHSVLTRLQIPADQKAQARELGLSLEMTVRLVSVRLPTGELEVLVTSLLNEADYPTDEFLEVYHWRWNHETYHQMLKGRLELENWTGQTLEAVRQDLQAAVLVGNLESLLSQEAQEQLSARDHQRVYPAQINRAVSYHALKEKMIDLLLSRRPVGQVILEIQKWMRSNPVSVRTSRLSPPPRRRPSPHRSYHFQRRLKKTVF
jgi:hypothetical protein